MSKMNSNYLNATEKFSSRARHPLKTTLLSLLSLLFVVFAGVTIGAPTAAADDDKALWEKIICSFDEDSWPRIAYQLNETSDDEFLLYSKSTLGASTGSINSVFNNIIDFVNTENGKYPNKSFEKRNEKIFGLKATDDDPNPLTSGTEPEKADSLNQGDTINFFDRFGVAGTSFTSYAGEWRHFWINACDGTTSSYNPTISTGGGSAGDGSAIVLDNNAAAIHGFTASGAMPKLLAATPSPPDFITLQETVRDAWSEQNIKAAAPGYNVVKSEPCSASRNVDTEKCLAIVYKEEYSVVASGDEMLTVGKESYKGKAKPDWERHALWATFSNGLTVVDVHLPTAGNYQAYKEGITNLIALLKQFNGPVVIGGDWNPGHGGGPQNREAKERLAPLNYVQAKINSHPNYFYYNTSTVSILNEGGKIPSAGITDHGNGAHWTEFSFGGASTDFSKVHLGNFNILGAGHTSGGVSCVNHTGNQSKCGWPGWKSRLTKTFKIFEDSGVSIVTLQEVHTQQQNAINKDYKDWEQFPSSGNQNKIIWKQSEWTMVESQSPKYTYSGGKAVMPIVRLSNTTSGEELYVMSIHNPATSQKGNTANRSANVEAQLEKLKELSTEGIPVVIAGDFNDGKDGNRASHCILTPDMINAFGAGSNDPCKKPAGDTAIDHIYGFNTAFSGSSSSDHQNEKISDHPFVETYLGSNATNTNNITSNLPDGGHGQFYDTRLIPRSTWSDIQKSIDPRTRVFSAGIDARFNNAMLTNFSNWLFSITKFIFVLSFAIVGLSFADVSSLIGLQKVIAGEDPACQGKIKAGCADIIQNTSGGGIVGNLFDNLFLSLLSMAFLMTAIYMIWHGIVKRQYRNALGGLFQAIACFFIAMMIFARPAFFIAIPNNTAVIGQALVASALGFDANGKTDKLCSSDVSGKLVKNQGGVDAEKSYSIVEEASSNFRSQLGCRWWKTLVLRPWLEGQFKEDQWQNLNGKAYADAGNRNTPYNDNTGENETQGWVGKPIVPRGGGETYENWALFQISTQTDVHYPVGFEDTLERGDYTQGVHTDWWRVVDAVSNYQEKIRTGAGSESTGQTSVEFAGPLNPDTMEAWDTWTGQDQGYRLTIVLSSIIVAAIAVAAPLFIAFIAVMYAIGVAILMAFAPIFFLFGCWAGRGQQLFRAWLSLVINLTIKRIMLGVILVFTVVITTNIIDMINKIGYWKAVLLMIVISVAIIRSRNQILNSVANVQLSSMNLASTAGRLPGVLKKGASTGLRIGATTTGAAVASKAKGGSLTGGALAGLKNEAREFTYRSSTLRTGYYAYNEVAQELDTDDPIDLPSEGDYCPLCGEPFKGGEDVAESIEWGNIHQDHVEVGDVDESDVRGEHIGIVQSKASQDNNARRRESIYKKNKVVEGQIDEILSSEQEKNIAAVTELAKFAVDEIERFKAQKAWNKNKGKSEPSGPAIPHEIAPYVDQNLIEDAWKKDNYDFIKLAYTHGWVSWANDHDPTLKNITPEQAQEIYIEVDSYATSNWRKSKPTGRKDSDRNK